jgi:hypothetical protein
MSLHSSFFGVGILVSILATGCQQPMEPIAYESVRVAVPDDADNDALWEATLEVLRRYRFVVDRKDRAAGVITTLPEVSAHWFEIWREENTTPYEVLESSIQTINREVTVNITPADDADTRLLSLKVAKMRLSAPERQVTNAVAARRLFSEVTPVQSGDVPGRRASTDWVPLGRDPHLEQRMMTRIVALAGAVSHAFVPEPAEPSVLPAATTQTSP